MNKKRWLATDMQLLIGLPILSILLAVSLGFVFRLVSCTSSVSRNPDNELLETKK
jgi:hypothetical protein